jgi:hypothetical protein
MKSSTTPGRSWTVFSVFLPSGQNRPSTTGGEL